MSHAIIRTLILVALFASVTLSATAQEVPAEYQQVLTALGKQGDFKDNVLKVNIPRNDCKVTVAASRRRRRSDSAAGWR